MTNFSLDTNILVNAFVKREPAHSLVLYRFSFTKHNICVDHNLVIENEYRKNLQQNDGFRKWYQRISTRQQFYRCNGRLPSVHVEQLKVLGCHEPTDQVFIGVAYNTDKILISEDSDVGKGSKGKEGIHARALEYLEKNMRLNVYDADEACQDINLLG